jgi:hypothetical protein
MSSPLICLVERLVEFCGIAIPSLQYIHLTIANDFCQMQPSSHEAGDGNAAKQLE